MLRVGNVQLRGEAPAAGAGGKNLNGDELLAVGAADVTTLFLGDGLEGPLTAGFGIWNGDVVDAPPEVIPTGGDGLGGGTTFGEEDDTGGQTGRGDAPPADDAGAAGAAGATGATGATGLGIANPAGCVGSTAGFGTTGATGGKTCFGDASRTGSDIGSLGGMGIVGLFMLTGAGAGTFLGEASLIGAEAGAETCLGEASLAGAGTGAAICLGDASLT